MCEPTVVIPPKGFFLQYSNDIIMTSSIYLTECDVIVEGGVKVAGQPMHGDGLLNFELKTDIPPVVNGLTYIHMRYRTRETPDR